VSALEEFHVEAGAPFVPDEPDARDAGLCFVIGVYDQSTIRVVVVSGEWKGRTFFQGKPSHRELSRGYAACALEASEELGFEPSFRLDAMHCAMLAAAVGPPAPHCLCGRSDPGQAASCRGCRLARVLNAHGPEVEQRLADKYKRYFKALRLVIAQFAHARRMAVDGVTELDEVIPVLLAVEDQEYELTGDTTASEALVDAAAAALGLDDCDLESLRKRVTSGSKR
jgi:hypothetical protein